MRMLITGAGGMLGHDVRIAAEHDGHEVTALARAELDVADANAVSAAVSSAQPEVIINCAAWTDVDGAEHEYEGALAVNHRGAGNVGAAAAAAGAWTLHVSTDYVFDGTHTQPYVESDETGPISGYGRSKLAGERALAAAQPGRHTIVRTAWLFGVTGSSFPKTILGLAAERDALRVVEDQVGSPTYTGHLGPALVALAGRPAGPPPGVLHLTAAGQCSWFQFAREIVDASGLECTVSPCPTAEFPRPAPRPAFSVLRSERPGMPELPHWREGLSAFMSGVEVRA